MSIMCTTLRGLMTSWGATSLMVSLNITFSEIYSHSPFMGMLLIGSSSYNLNLWPPGRILRMIFSTIYFMMQSLKSWETKSIFFLRVSLKHSRLLWWYLEHTREISTPWIQWCSIVGNLLQRHILEIPDDYKWCNWKKLQYHEPKSNKKLNGKLKSWTLMLRIWILRLYKLLNL